MTPILDIENLEKRYGRVHALRGINIQLTEPGVYGFLGPNGAGKTTAIKVLAGLLRPSAGAVRIGGVDVRKDPVTALKRTGVMMESPQFYPHLSGRANLEVLSRYSGQQDNTRVDRLLDRVGLSGKSEEKTGSYSRGMRQRLGLAAALLDDPQLVVLDEPANGLDPAGIAEVRGWLVGMAREEGKTVFLSSHQMGEVERICDTIIIINEGQIVASGPTDELVRTRASVIITTPDVAGATRVLGEQTAIESVESVDSDKVRANTSTLSSGDINRLLMDQGIDVTEISVERESLEDVFFRLVGRRHDVA